jgi:hypothetical protein
MRPMKNRREGREKQEEEPRREDSRTKKAWQLSLTLLFGVEMQ